MSFHEPGGFAEVRRRSPADLIGREAVEQETGALMSYAEQFDAILAVPIGGAVIAAAMGFFAMFFAVARHVIERNAERRERLLDAAARMHGTARHE